MMTLTNPLTKLQEGGPKMRVYISCHHPHPAQKIAAVIISGGHEVVSSWHVKSGPPPAREDVTSWRKIAARNFNEIETADVLVCVAADSKQYGPGGKFVEAGYALGLDKPVLSIGAIENGMMNHPNVRLVHEDQVLEELRKLDD